MQNLQNPTDIPLVVKPGRQVREELAEKTGADPAKPWILFCFNGLEFESGFSLERFPEVQFFGTNPLPGGFSIPPDLYPFRDLVATADAVITKPGFGILSDCAANDTPIIYVEREGFREYPVLVEGIERCLRPIHLPLRSLYSGELGETLEILAGGLPEPAERLACDGADEVAKLLRSVASV